ncbi:MAG: diguanylate cyclase [Dehalococcoidia bacterium]|nr:diguanylate cyclase [Dehalococcoidia bacterium]
MKWFDLRRLDGYLPPELEKAYRLYHLKDDIRVASITMSLLCLLLVVFGFNDYLLFGFSPVFYFLISLRSAYFIYFLILIFFLRKIVDPHKYDVNLFVWLVCSMALVLVINLTRPASYTGYLVIDVILVLLVYLAMPMPMLARSLGALFFTAGDIFIFYILRHASSPAISYASIMALVMANIGGMYTSGHLYSFRRNAFKARIEESNSREELQKAAQEISDLYHNAPSGYHSLDKDGVFVRINDTELEWLGYTREETIGKKKFPDVITPESLEKFKNEFPGFKERGWARDLEFDMVRKDGTVMPVLVSATAIKDQSGNYLMSRSTVFDITEIKRLRDVVTESEKKYRTILEEMHDAYFEVDLAGNYTFVNNRLCEMLLYSREELMGTSYRHFIAEEDFKGIFTAYNKVFRTGESNKGVVMKAVRKDGTTWFAECSISPIRNQKGKITGFRSVARDVSERVELQNRLSQMAMHDGLTGLPNRVLLNDRFEMAVARAQRQKKKLTIMILDLDKFKLINDTLGHGTGDGLLKSVSARLSMLVRKSDTVARIGGDEFVVLLPEIAEGKDAMNTAQKIVKAFGRPFTVDGHDLNITTSIGIALFPDNGEDMEELLKKADTAMYYAKEHGRNSYKLAEN